MKKSRFVVNPQKYTVSYISEGEVIKNPKALIEKTQQFYKEKGIDIPVQIFEDAYLKEMLSEKKISFKINPKEKTVQFINESNLPIKNKKKIVESAKKFYNKKGFNIPVNIFEAAIDPFAEEDYGYLGGEKSNNSSKYSDELYSQIRKLIKSYGYESVQDAIRNFTLADSKKLKEAMEDPNATDTTLLKKKGTPQGNIDPKRYMNVQNDKMKNKPIPSDMEPATMEDKKKLDQSGKSKEVQTVSESLNENVAVQTFSDLVTNLEKIKKFTGVSLTKSANIIGKMIINSAKTSEDRERAEDDYKKLIKDIKSFNDDISSKIDTFVKKFTAHLPKVGPQNLLSTTEFVPESKINDLIKFLAENRDSLTEEQLMEAFGMEFFKDKKDNYSQHVEILLRSIRQLAREHKTREEIGDSVARYIKRRMDSGDDSAMRIYNRFKEVIGKFGKVKQEEFINFIVSNGMTGDSAFPPTQALKR